MNAVSSNFDEHEFNYRSRETESKSSGSHNAPNASRRSKASARRRSNAPTQFNEMHRRRRKKINW